MDRILSISELLYCTSNKQMNMQIGLKLSSSYGPDTHYILWSMNPNRGFSAMLEEKKCQKNLVKKSTLYGMSEEKNKKKKPQCQFFFLIWHILSSLKESWTKEYSECCLSHS